MGVSIKMKDKSGGTVKATVKDAPTMGINAKDIEKQKRLSLMKMKKDTNTISLQRYKKKKAMERKRANEKAAQERARSQSRKTATSN